MSSSSPNSSCLNLLESADHKINTMDPSEHLCYVRCSFCNTILAVRIIIIITYLTDISR